MEESKVETIEEEVEVVISNDTDETQTDNAVSTDDELDEYTKGVSKRVNKLNQRAREAEERAQYFEQQAVQKDVQINTLRNQTSQLGQNVLLAEEQSIESKEQQANELYKKA